MLHAITAPDALRKNRDRTILWDDRRGTVRGTHSVVRELDAMFERTKREVPLVVRSYHGNLILNDPRHSAPDFIALAGWTVHVEFEWPDSLRDVTPTAWHTFERKAGYEY